MDAAENQMHTLSSPRSSFSYKEYQNQKLRSDRRRPASFDLNNQAMNVTSSSPRLKSAMTTSASARRTPYYQKGWSSERVPLNTNTNKSTLMVYNNNWKALSSKWEDAERWIVSPVAGEDGLNHSGQQQNRTKSKSGPLGPHESESPVLTGVNVDYNSLIQYQNGRDNNGNVCSVMDHCIARSVSMHGGSELPSQHSSLRIAQDASRRDMATQMSPESSPTSSPTKPPSSSILTVDLQHVRSSKSDIRDVQVDDQITLTPYRRSKSNVEVDRKNKGLDMRESFSKVQREEAKIIAWENLQKAKADAAMRKLEMKLEKKRSSSMDRIINKLQSAQKKAQEMRESVLSDEPPRVDKSSHKPVSFIKIRHVRFLTGCFARPAF
ncbi:uncharacterized protein LOC143573283 isoform X2 [Bidens hawaiensis]|uniref:uncharacterized protein LOC143573283 isoform X2 n=1 Tax=Bidens hawaiensis TaxID=980011 RepID=UPI00404B3F00